MKKCDSLCCTKIKNLSVDGILENINIHIHCGEITAVIGCNGAGKSTLLKAIIGEVKHKGEVSFLGKNGNTTPIIGYVPQTTAFDGDCPATVSDLFDCCGASDGENVQKAIKAVNADGFFDRKLCNLSGGELQRALLALALVPVPNLLLLDEPVSGVDKGGTEQFWNVLSQIRATYDITIIIVSHSLNQVKSNADRVILLDKKIVAHGTPDEVFLSREFAEVFDNNM
ncbi:MAG: ATP-binding cassette domain-containing protein [Clostridia bacterium]|nr:ATP-binding cassette domain-containing protein [Clostridia bacterium]